MKNILLIFGGKSFEHDISIITALIVKNRYNGKFNLVPVYIDRDNEWFYFAGKNLNSHMFKDFKNTYKQNQFYKAFLKTNDNCLYYKKGLFYKKIEIYSAINCCHGGIGECGMLSDILLASKIPVSSGGHTALGICMDKLLSKYCFDGLKIPFLKYFKTSLEEWKNDREHVLKKVENVGYPVIIKPASLGSSIGIFVAKNKEEFLNNIESSLAFDEKVLIEKAVLDKMVEFNIAVMKKDGKIILSEIDKPLRSDEILSFKDKYIGDEKNVPSKNGVKNTTQKATSKGGGYLSENKKFVDDLPKKLVEKIRQISEKVYTDLGLYGVCRIDFIMDKKMNIYLNEINAVPGSLAYYFFIPKMFKSMGEFIDCLAEEGVIEYMKEDKFKKEFETKLFD